ncbi:GAF and ANTAR domain-containing protein [Microlunatus panaciterrae]|uniref:GAF domain-containing protein n=1 Tax=Microlunatus panaciterrae TaxID=400768 RepID=A0ABS2RN39_9ACTN|nr:GAF and ANTAR domain-containing protein [Microlunatus panaciterrae]MBM7800410.1 GAF domain-containing protein [Microlunatus panaciterrae]
MDVQLASSLAEMTIDMVSQPDVAQTLDTVVQNAVQATAADGAGVLLIRPGQVVQTAAASDEVVRRAEALQSACGEGPCLQAIWSHDTFLVRDTRADERWPRWAAGVAELGWRCILGVRLFTKQTTIGALNLFSQSVDAFDPDDVDVAEIFGQHASLALMAAQEDAGLRAAIGAKHLIGQAQGILMERYGIDADRAFAVLRRHSQDSNVKLRTVAEQVIETRRLPEQRTG